MKLKSGDRVTGTTLALTGETGVVLEVTGFYCYVQWDNGKITFSPTQSLIKIENVFKTITLTQEEAALIYLALEGYDVVGEKATALIQKIKEAPSSDEYAVCGC